MSITRVGSPVGNNVGAVTTLPLTYSPTEGNFVAVLLVYLNSTDTILSVTDNGATGGSTYVAAVNEAAYATNWCTALFYTLAAKSGVTTITATVTVAGAMVGIVSEYAGIATSAALDTISTRKTNSATSHTTNSVTPVAGLNELLIGYFFQNSDQTDFTAAGSYTTLFNQNETTSGANLCAIDQLVASTTGSYTADATTVGVVGSGTYIATFKASAGTPITGLGRKFVLRPQ